MKKRVHFTSQFKKDFKRYANQHDKLVLFYNVLSMLEDGKRIPGSFYPHKLHHDYKGCMECHILDDFLLIWLDGNIIELLRLGSHSELYGKGKKK